MHTGQLCLLKIIALRFVLFRCIVSEPLNDIILVDIGVFGGLVILAFSFILL